MMAEWEAMAAEGEEDAQSAQEGQEAGLAAGTAVKAPRQAPGEAQKSGGRMPAIHEVSLEAYAILGTASMPVTPLLRMGRGAVVELDTGPGDEIPMRIRSEGRR